MTPVPPRVDRFIEFVHGEYRELPGLHLTKSQMRRLLGVDVETCNVVVDRLEREKFLRHTPEDDYVLEPGVQLCNVRR